MEYIYISHTKHTKIIFKNSRHSLNHFWRNIHSKTIHRVKLRFKMSFLIFVHLGRRWGGQTVAFIETKNLSAVDKQTVKSSV